MIPAALDRESWSNPVFIVLEGGILSPQVPLSRRFPSLQFRERS